MNRKSFLFRSASLLTATSAWYMVGGQNTPATDTIPTPAPKRKRPDPLPPELVKEFVGKAHSDLAAVKILLAETPSLLNASWDWGGGDFETALGGASHMGQIEIAEYLIEQGARSDIFSAAMLGRLEVVNSLILAFPPMLYSKGAHGISLLTHAQKGGERALAVVGFLKTKGLEK